MSKARQDGRANPFQEKLLTDQALEDALANLTAEEREQVEAEVAAKAAEQKATAAADLYDARQDGQLNDPRDLGPVGGSHV